MKKIMVFLCTLVLALSAAAGFAYTIDVKVGGVSYTGRTFGNGVEYRVNGSIVGYAKDFGGSWTYTDPRNNILGSVRKLGNTWEYRDPRNVTIAKVEEIGGSHTYKSAKGSVIGYAVPLGPRTEYRAGNNLPIGKADTDTLPLRPIPLERYLIQQKKANAVCLIRITKLVPDGQAIAAGLQLGDFMITFAGKDWTVFNFLNPSYKEVLSKVSERVKAAFDDEGLVMIVYRPVPGECDHAGGAIVKSAPMKPGMKGYTYTSAEECEYYTVAGSKKYAAEIKAIYERWLQEQKGAAQ